MASCNDLPVEIAQRILGFVAGAAYPPHIYARNVVSFNKVAVYTPVCKVWQTVFEHYSFNSLAVDGNQLVMFNEVMTGTKAHRLRYLEKLKLLVRLPSCGCLHCVEEETLDEAHL